MQGMWKAYPFIFQNGALKGEWNVFCQTREKNLEVIA